MKINHKQKIRTALKTIGKGILILSISPILLPIGVISSIGYSYWYLSTRNKLKVIQEQWVLGPRVYDYNPNTKIHCLLDGYMTATFNGYDLDRYKSLGDYPDIKYNSTIWVHN